jgi:hypothetical protein
LPTPYKHPVVTALTCSFLAHFGVVCLLQTDKTTSVVQAPPVIDVVQAKLFFYSKDNALEIAEQTAPIMTIQQSPTQQATVASKQTVSESRVTVQAKISEQTLEQQLVTPSAQKPAKPALFAEPKQSSAFISPLALQSKAAFPDSLAKRQLQTFHQGQIDRLATEAAQSFRQDQATALMPTNKGTNLLSEEERWRAAITKNVDCSSTTNRSIAIASILFGGRLTCTEPPAIDSFIQAHLHKGLAPEQKTKAQSQK